MKGPGFSGAVDIGGLVRREEKRKKRRRKEKKRVKIKGEMLVPRAFTQNGLLKIMLKSFFHFYIYNAIEPVVQNHDDMNMIIMSCQREKQHELMRRSFFWILFKLLDNKLKTYEIKRVKTY